VFLARSWVIESDVIVRNAIPRLYVLARLYLITRLCLIISSVRL
jgi:hypothetical protein